MSKEMIVVSSSHETKIAMLEDEQVAEVYFEREKKYSLAGSIYKGRVTRVLPGMQSAFVDIGLERDAFLYVSDFFEDSEEYDTVATTVAEKAEQKVVRVEEEIGETSGEDTPAIPVAATSGETESKPKEKPSTRTMPSEDAPPAKSPASGGRSRHFSRRPRRRPSRSKGFPESKYASRPDSAPPAASSPAPLPPAPTVLPGESLAKYRAVADVPAESPVEQRSGSSEETPAPLEERAEISIAVTEPPPSESLEEQHAEPEVQEKMSPLQAPVEIQPVEEDLKEERMAKETPAPEPSLPEGPRAETSEAFTEEPAAFIEGGQLDEQSSAAETGLAEETPAEILSAGLTPVEPISPETAEDGGQLKAARKDAEVEGSEKEKQMPQQATVRDGHRNPRYQQRSRWGGRREGRPGPGSRGGHSKDRETPKPLIADLLKEGQELIVQIAKEPLGKKGARITSHIALPGRYLVFMPTVNHVGISRRIASGQERQRLKHIILSNNRDIAGGFIARTAAEDRSEEDLRQDILFLSNLWAEIKQQAEKAPPPVLLHHDWNLVLRTLRDQLSEEFSAIWVDSEQEYERIISLVSKFQPSLVNRIKLYTKDVPLFEELGIQEEINKALKPKVWLKSGGYIVINQTEALVAIDVNTGKFVGKSNRLEDTIVKTNVDAIQEIVRQIRLRDLGGIIVIDFIDMDERKNRQKVMAAMEDALKADKAPSKVLSFNEFGLIAITRKRVRQSLERTLCQPCSYCNNSGLVKSPATVCNEILAEAKKLSSQLERKQVTLRVNPDVAKVLKSRDNTFLQEIEEFTRKDVIVRNDPLLHMESFDFH